MKIVGDTIEHRERNKIKRNDFLDLLIDLKNKGKDENNMKEKKNKRTDVGKDIIINIFKHFLKNTNDIS